MTSRPAPYTAAVVQLAIDGLAVEETIEQDIASNRAKMLRWMRFLCEDIDRKPRLIVFPFLPLTGSRPRPLPPRRTPFRTTAPVDAVFDPLIAACAKYDCFIAFSQLDAADELDGDTIATGLILSADGIILRQPKFQVHGDWELEAMRAKFARYVAAVGEENITRVVDTPIGRLGSMLDRDLLIPEVGRLRARAGAEVVVHPSFSWFDVDMPFVEMRQSHAFQNCLYLLTANPAFERWEHEGQEVHHASRGNSMICDPYGKILARCGEGEGFALATIDLQAAADARAGHGQVTLPIWEFYAHNYGR